VAARVETARRAAGRRNRDMAGLSRRRGANADNCAGILFSLSTRHRNSSTASRLGSSGIGGSLGEEGMVWFGVSPKFQEGISGPGQTKKIPKLTANGAQLFFSLGCRWKACSWPAANSQGLYSAWAPPKRPVGSALLGRG
jgi:hypothetical protein